MYVAPTELWLFYFLMLLTCGTAGAGIQNLLVNPSSGQQLAPMVPKPKFCLCIHLPVNM
jgi:hypothetical protein